jgi:hypothetical protein
MEQLKKWDLNKRYLGINLFLNAKNMNLKINENMKISFNTSDTVSGAVSEANIDIVGLNREDIAFLSSSTNQYSGNYKQNKIDIIAGYDNQQGRIFSGNLTEATPNLNTADYSVQIKAVSGFYESLGNPLSIARDGKTKVEELAKIMADNLNIPLNNNLKNTYYIENYGYSKTITEHLRLLSDLVNIDVYQSNGELFLKERTQPLNLKPFKISYKSNIIGSPETTPTGCNVNIKLNPHLKTGQQIEVESLKFPLLNTEKYILTTLSHSGDTKGNQWQSYLKLIKKSIYGNEQ